MGGRKREEDMRHKETATRMNRKHISAATAATITVLTGKTTLSMTYSC